MPIDLVETDPRISVEGRDGSRVPYSRGVMATSLLATGIRTEEAYRLASLVQARLHTHQRHDIDTEALSEITHGVLDVEATSNGVAKRWMAWRRAMRSRRPIVVVLTGAPGVGTKTLATRLAVRLDIAHVITTDVIREVLRLVVPADVLPELHRSTFVDHTDGRFTGGDDGRRGAPLSGYDRQCAAIGAAAATAADRFSTEHRSSIVEGVHVVPGTVTDRLAANPSRPIVVERLITLRQAEHRTADLRAFGLGWRPDDEHAGDGSTSRFPAIRAIHDHLVERADAAGITTIDAHDAGDLTQSIVDEVAAADSTATTP